MKIIKSYKVLVLDFDGVICDSRNECLELSLRCFLDLEPHYFQELVGDKLEKAKEYFLKNRGLVRPARNFFALWTFAITFPERDWTVFEFELEAQKFSNKLVDFEKILFKYRKTILKNEPASFVLLNPFYGGVKKTWEKFNVPIFIVSTKDSGSIKLLLKSNGIKAQGVFGLGPKSKVENIKLILSKHDISPDDLIFVDDNPDHLNDVAQLGVKTFWASWGYGPIDLSKHTQLTKFEEIIDIF